MKQFPKKKNRFTVVHQKPIKFGCKNYYFKFFFSGPRKPLFFVPSTPKASPNTSSSSWEKFPEDTSILESESENGDTTLDLINKMVCRKSVLPPCKKFKFKQLSDEKIIKRDISPELSLHHQQLPEVFEISSDEELETSMMQLEQQISLEMDSE